MKEIDTYNIYGLTQEKKAQRVELGRWCKYEDVQSQRVKDRDAVVEEIKDFEVISGSDLSVILKAINKIYKGVK